MFCTRAYWILKPCCNTLPLLQTSAKKWTNIFFSYAEGEDYAFDRIPPVIDILTGMTGGCLTITIIPSDLAEDIESIDLLINQTTPMANVLEERTTITIDADGSTQNNCSLSFINIFHWLDT